MTINNLFTTSEYHQYIVSLDPDAPLNYQSMTTIALSKRDELKWNDDNARSASAEIAEIESEVKFREAKKPAHISSTYFAGKNKNNFIRITNVADWVPKSDAALVVDAKNYLQLQQLGITINIDQSLTAKVINLFGDYRFRVLKDQEQYDLRTTLFSKKENICQHAFNRLYALQKIERAFGQDFRTIDIAINDYEKTLKQLISQRLRQSNIWPESVRCIADKRGNPLDNLRARLRMTISFEERLWINECINLFEDLENVETLYYELVELKLVNATINSDKNYGVDLTKFPIEKFVRATTNHIIDDAKFANELITIANGESMFRGLLEDRLAKAENFCTNFTFHQNHLILPEHQGDYSRQQQVTVRSIYAIGNKREDLRRFLFAASVVLTDTPDPFLKSDPQLTVSKTRGWTRLFRHERTEKKASPDIFANYKILRATTLRANMSWGRSAAEDFVDIPDIMVKGLSKLARGVLSAFGHEFYKVGADFIVEKPPLLKLSRVGDKHEIKLNATEHKVFLQEKWHHAPAEELLKHVIDYIVKDQRPPLKLNQAGEAFLKMQRQKTKAQTAPLAMPPTHLDHTDPDDFVSSIIHGFESFYQMFDQIYEASPCTALFATCMYVLGGLAAVNPELTQTLFNTIHMGALAPYFIAWNTATAKMMTKGKMSNFVSAGFTLAQELFVTADILSKAGDSVGGDLCRLLGNHLPKAIGGVVAASSLGYLVTRDFFAKIPIIGRVGAAIKEDIGTVPAFEEFFAGVKLGTLTHEALQSKPEGQSVPANFISFCLKCTLLPVRLAVSPINLLLAIKTPERLHNAAKPWQELGDSVKSGFLRVADATLRLLNLAGKVIKRVFKTPAEFMINSLVVITKFAGKPLVNPNNNPLSAKLIALKVMLFNFFGSGAHQIKNSYRHSRNTLARQLRVPSNTRSTTALVNQNFDEPNPKLAALKLTLVEPLDSLSPLIPTDYAQSATDIQAENTHLFRRRPK